MRYLASLLTVTLWLAATTAFAAQPPRPATPADESAVRQADALYWRTFNDCDLDAMAPLLAVDVEFYHDRTGLTTTRQGVIDSLRRGPCADPDMTLRRQAVPGSVTFHPLAGGFALLTGEHRFYVSHRGKPEYLDGEAAFTTLWQLDGSQWRMRRILSYDHHPVAYVPPKPALALTRAEALRCAGRYRTTGFGDIVVTPQADHLKLTAGSFTATLYRESAQRYFAVERDLRFSFTDDRHAKALTLTVYEHGNVVASGQRID